jgi:hypothetical protein
LRSITASAAGSIVLLLSIFFFSSDIKWSNLL